MRTRIIRTSSASYFVIKIVNNYANYDATTPLRIASPHYSRLLCHVTLLRPDRFALCGSFFFRLRRFGNFTLLLEATIECFVTWYQRIPNESIEKWECYVFFRENEEPARFVSRWLVSGTGRKREAVWVCKSEKLCKAVAGFDATSRIEANWGG